MKEFPVMVKSAVVWVPESVLRGQGPHINAKWVECEVLEFSGAAHPSVKLARATTEQYGEFVWVNKRMVETVRPK